MGVLSWSSAKSGLIEDAKDRLQLAAATRRDGIELVAGRLQADFLATTGHPQIISNFPDLIETLDPANPEYAIVMAAIQGLDTDVARLAFDGASTNTMYGRRHVKVQDVARRLVTQPGCADLIFLDQQGHIVYTTTKGADFAKSLSDPILSGTDLARLVERLKTADTSATLFEDFSPYPVGAGPSAFIGGVMAKRANVAMGTAQAEERIGYIVMRVTPALFDQTLGKRDGLGETGQIMAAGADGLLRSNPPLNREAKAGAAIGSLGVQPAELTDGRRFAYDANGGAHMAAAAAVSVLGAPWMVVAEQSEAEATGAVQALSRTLALAALCVLVSTSVLGLLLARSIVVPLGALTRALQALSARERVVEVPGSNRKDEIGEIARAVVTIRDISLEEAAQQIKTTEAGRLREEHARRALLRDLADGFEGSVGGIVNRVGQAVGSLQVSSGVMRSAVAGTAQRSSNVAGAAHQTAGNVDALATAAEELAATVDDISRQIIHATGMSAAAVTAATRTEETMSALAAAAARIGDVVGMVSMIAGQTNLLALNATIEAARAGEAGRGFAVVAAEVKGLANQTAKATDEIGQQVAAIHAATSGASREIQGIAGQILEMSRVTTSVSAAVEQQSATTREIVRSMTQASAGAGEVTANIAEVAVSAAEAGEAASSVAMATDELAGQSAQLRREVEQFLNNVRAA